jgi:hypothetical protein
MGDYEQLFARLEPARRSRWRSSPASSIRSRARSSRPAGCSRSSRSTGRARCQGRRADHAAPDDDGREDPRLAPGRSGDGPVREARRRLPGARRRRLQPRVHDRAGAPLPAAGVRRRLPRQNPAKFAVFEDHLLYADGVARMALRRRSRRCAAAARVPAPHRRARLLGEGRRLARASATKWRASTSSTPATSSRPPTATRAWAAATTRSRGASAPPSTRASSTRASRSSRCPSRSASSSSALTRAAPRRT